MKYVPVLNSKFKDIMRIKKKKVLTLDLNSILGKKPPTDSIITKTFCSPIYHIKQRTKLVLVKLFQPT